MGTTIGSLAVMLKADSAEFTKGIAQAEKQLGSFRKANDFTTQAVRRHLKEQKAAAVDAEYQRLFGKGGGILGAIGKGGKGILGAGGFGIGAAATVAGAAGLGIAAVSKSNPGTYDRFTRTIEDVMAVFGQRLAPVLEIVTEAFRLIGDVLHTILPSGQEFREMLKPISDLFGALRPILGMVATLLNGVLGAAIKVVGFALNGLATAIKWVAEKMGEPFVFAKRAGMMGEGNMIAEVLHGLKQNREKIGGKGKNAALDQEIESWEERGRQWMKAFEDPLGMSLKSSVGAAARPAAYSSLEEFSRSNALLALNSASVDQQQLSEQRKTNGFLAQIAMGLGGGAAGAMNPGAPNSLSGSY